ncbi:6-phosphogluconolactonase [Kaarinaea lacus]
MTKIYSYETVDQMNEAVVTSIVEKATATLQHQNAFHIALAGGSTPKSVYERMASEKFQKSFPWDQMHFYFGDERCVPADHADSNYRMAKHALLSKVPIPDSNVHPILVDVQNISASAERYASELKHHLPLRNTTPAFDLVLLGIGDDGHTASLFPGTDILEETGKWVGAVYVEKFNAWRISLTYPVINAAANVFVIAAGSGKSNILKEVLVENSMDTPYPVQRINPTGELVWYVDAAAASLLPSTMLTSHLV